MARSGSRVQDINIPYPDAPSASLELVLGGPGSVQVGGGAENAFITGSIEYDREAWTPRIEQRGNVIRIVQAERIEDRIDFSLEAVNRWDLHLGKEKPFSLGIKCGVNRGRWDLGGLPLTDLHIETGVSENSFLFETENPETMRDLDLRCGVAAVDMEGLLNANFQRMDVKGGVGSVTMRFTGQRLKRDSRLKIEGGVGQFTIIVDRSVAARAKITGLVGVTTRGDFHRESVGSPFGGTYQTTAYGAGSGPRLEIDIAAGISGITLETT